MSHLTDSELVDALEGSLTALRVGHVRDCTSCRDRLAFLAETLASTRQADVPEPSPLFWDHLSTRIRAAISAQPRPVRHGWLTWPVLAPLTGLALVVMALLSGLAREVPPTLPEAVATADDMQLQNDAAVEAAWALAANLIGMPDALAVFDADVLIAPGSAEFAAAHLTPDEQAELVRLLRLELKTGG